MPDKTARPPRSTPQSRIATLKQVICRVPLSRVQTIVGTIAGLLSIAGALISWTPLGRWSNTGKLVAVVQEAGSHRLVTDATVEVLTADNAVVATLTPDSTGRATQPLKEGVYAVRVSHPRYAADVRRIQVAAGQTVEVRSSLRAGASSPLERAVNKGVNAARRAFHF